MITLSWEASAICTDRRSICSMGASRSNLGDGLIYSLRCGSSFTRSALLGVPPLFTNDGAPAGVVPAVRSLIRAVNGDVAVDAMRRPKLAHLAPDDGDRL